VHGSRGGGGPSARVAVEHHARFGQRRQRLGQKPLSHVGVHEQGLGRVAYARALDLRVEHDRAPPLEVGAVIDVDVAVAGRGVDDRDRRDALERRLQPFATAGHDQVHEPGLRGELGDLVAPAPEQTDRVAWQTDRGDRGVRDPGQGRVGATGG